MKIGSKRRTWTSVQVRELKSLSREKVPARSIARRLKRTEEAARKKALRVYRWTPALNLQTDLTSQLASALRSKLKPRHVLCAGLFSYHFVHIYIVRQRYRAAFLRP